MTARRILLGVTGSVAAALTPKLVAALKEIGAVQTVATERALYFFRRDDVGPWLWTESDEWPNASYTRDQPVPHITLGDWADVLVVAPLSANTLAKMALSLGGDLLTDAYRAWPAAKPLVIAPAMNTRMWQNEPTTDHLAALCRRHAGRLVIVPPVAKRLACGSEGVGALADIADIAAAAQCLLD